MRSYTFDIETDGLIAGLTHVKCLNIIDNETGLEYRFNDSAFYRDAYSGEPTNVPCNANGTIKEGLGLLMKADEVCGHNIVGFDIPAIQKIYPWFILTCKILDTQIASRLMYTDIGDRDALSQRKGKFLMDKKLAMKPHSLAAWGLRLGGERKGDFVPSDFGWKWTEYPFSKECDDYCMQDVRTNVGVVEHMRKRLNEWSWMEALELETQVQVILTRQMLHGWLYDVPAAEALVAVLMVEKIELEDSLQDVFQPWFKNEGDPVVCKRSMRRFIVSDLGGTTRKYKGETQTGYYSYTDKGVEHQKVKLISFNPGSRDQIANRLTHLYDWQPEKFTPSGKPQVDESVLGELPWAEAKECAKYFLVNKKLGQVAEGKAAQLKKVGDDNRMRGYVNHNGAITGRMSHSGPNVAQTDTDPRIRSLYIVPEGKTLIGVDADGIEGCCLAHYLGIFDGGAYVDVILNGSKKDGTDLHSRNRDSVGLRSRDNAKTIFYAWMYGAGDPKLGATVYEDWPAAKQTRFNERFKGRARVERLARIGRKARGQLVSGIEGMDQLIAMVKTRAKERGFVKGLDGRKVYTRAAYAALNTLLQSAGAMIMKVALVLLDNRLQAEFTPGKEYEFVGNIHDELQLEVDSDVADQIGMYAEQAITDAGAWFNLRCPMSGTFKAGKNWSETH